LNLSRLALSYPWLTLGFWLAIAVAGLMAFSSLQYALFPDVTFPIVIVNATAPLKDLVATEQGLTIPLEEQLKGIDKLESYESSTYQGRSVIRLSFVAASSTLEAAQQRVKYALAQAELPKETNTEIFPYNLNESSVVSYVLEGADRDTLYAQASKEILPVLRKLRGVLRVELLGAVDVEPIGVDTTKTPLMGPTLVRFNGKDALSVQVIKAENANTLELVDKVQAAIEQLTQLRPNLKLKLAFNQATYIHEATQATVDSLLLAIVLAVLVIFPFLWSWRATLITALAIPVTLLGTFIVMKLCHFNLETITLLALALVIGIIVDDGIVDVENIIRHIEGGQSPKQAALNATAEIGLTVSAAALTIVAVFLPVGLMGGAVGQFFKPFGITVSAAVIASLLAARTLSPVLASFWLKRPPQLELGNSNNGYRRNTEIESSKSQGAFWQRLMGQYDLVLRWALSHRFWVVLLATVSFGAGIALIPLIPQGFIPQLDRGEFNVVYTISPSYLETTLREKFASNQPSKPSKPNQSSASAKPDQTAPPDEKNPATPKDSKASGSDDLKAYAAFLEGLAPEQIELLKIMGRSAARSYVVREGEDLKTIAQKFLSSEDRWPVLAKINRLGQPDAVQPGEMIMVLDLPITDGKSPQKPRKPSSPEDQFAPLVLQESRTIAQKLETVIQQNSQVESFYTILGEQRNITRGRIYIKLKHDRALRTPMVQEQLRKTLPELEGVTLSIEDIRFVETGSDQPLKVAFQGDNWHDLVDFVQTLKAKVVQIPGLVDVVATGDEDQYKSQQQQSKQEESKSKEPEPKSAGGRNNPILHLDGQRVVYIKANLDQRKALGEATNQVVQEAQKILPPGVTIRLGSDSKRSRVVLDSFIKTLTLSIGCILIVLLLLFRRLLDPLVILLALPLSVVGAMLGLLVTRSDFGMISVIGMIFLLGLVNKHAIIIVDYTNQLRQHLSRQDALLTACPIRLRPILMTTLSTILAMLPIAIGFGAGSELRQPMAVAIIGGLMTSSLLSLIVVPVLYTLVDDAQGFLLRGLGWQGMKR
jgi:multidrug efflux pump subunit AcrB